MEQKQNHEKQDAAAQSAREIQKNAAQAEIEMYREYLVCRKRGHTSLSISSINVRPYVGAHTCRWCGVLYWKETVLRESNVPLRKEPTRVCANCGHSVDLHLSSGICRNRGELCPCTCLTFVDARSL